MSWIRVGGTARRYRNTETGEELSRRQYQKRMGNPLPSPKRAPKSTKSRIKPFPEHKILPKSYFETRKATHRWYKVSYVAKDDAKTRTSATQRYQFEVMFTFLNEKTEVVYRHRVGYSAVYHKWTYHYKDMLVEAANEAMSRIGTSGLTILEIESVNVITYRFLTRSKRNITKYGKGGF